MIDKTEKRVEKEAFTGLRAAMATVNDEFPIETAIAKGIEQDIHKAQVASLSPITSTPNISVQVPTEYHSLHTILRLAFEQSAYGKGKERHASGPTGTLPWLDQPINSIGRMVGPGFAAGQVQKKVQEAVTMIGNNQCQAARNEVLGAIVYAAALYQLFTEIEAGRKA